MMGQLKISEIIFNSKQTVFKTGEFIDGKCVIELNEDISCKFLQIKVKGISRVDFKIFDNNYSDSERYFNFKRIYLENGKLFLIF